MKGTILLFLTVLLVAGGVALYVTGLVGFAQCLWVFASGTAGAGVMAILEEHRD